MSIDHDTTRNENDDVARLIRLAGQRPAIPPERIERARKAAHAVWRAGVRRNARTRLIWSTVALAAAASIVVAALGLLRRDATQRIAGVGGSLPVELMAGAAQLREASDGGFAPARSLESSASIAPDSIISTSATERAALRLGNGHSLRLDIGTRVRVVDAGTIYLDAGAIYLASAEPRKLDDRINVLTAFGEIREIGTQFEVRLSDDKLRVRVREGEVILSQDRITHEIGVGTEILMDADGSAVTRRISTHGPEWAWIAGVTPMMDLEGRTAREFLEWSAREQGRSLVFENDELAAAAETIVVAGDIGGMTIDQALDAVLPSCRMSHRVADEALFVTKLP